MKKKLLTALLICLCTAVLLSVSAFAADEYTVTLQADKAEYLPGETATVTVSIAAPESVEAPTLGAFEFTLTENDEQGLLTRGSFVSSFANAVKNDETGAGAAAATETPFCTAFDDGELVLGAVSYTVSDGLLAEDVSLSVGIENGIFAYDAVSGKDAALPFRVVSVPFTVKKNVDFEFRVTVNGSDTASVKVGDVITVSEQLFGTDDTSNRMPGLTSNLYYDTQYFELVSYAGASGFTASHLKESGKGKFRLTRYQQNGFTVAQGAEIGSVTLRAIRATDDVASAIYVSDSSVVNKTDTADYVSVKTPASVTVAPADEAFALLYDAAAPETVTVTNYTAGSVDVYVYVAQYDADGRMLSVAVSDSQTVAGLCGTAEIALPAGSADAAKTKIMLLDADFIPLSTAAER